MKKLAFYHHWDKNDIVDDYSLYSLKALTGFGFKVIFTSNSRLTDTAISKLSPLTADIITRSNQGFDFGAWKQALLKYRKEVLECESLLLLNNSCFGPVVPLSESFNKMAAIDADYWGISSCENYPDVPDHLYSYFMCFTARVIKSDAFWDFWKNKVYDYTDFWDAVYEGERGLSAALKKAGFRYRTVAEMPDITPIPECGHRETFSLFASDYLVRKYRIPFVKVKAFSHEDSNPFDTGGLIIDAIKKINPDFPVEHIYRYLNRTQPLSWQKNLPERTKVFSTTSSPAEKPGNSLTLAVLVHIPSAGMLNDTLTYLYNIPVPYTLLISTNLEKEEKNIRKILQESQLDEKITVKIATNCPGDIFSQCQAFSLQKSKFELCLRLDISSCSKNLPEAYDFKNRSFQLDSLLCSTDYICNILNTFAGNPDLGMMFPVCPPCAKLTRPREIYENISAGNKLLEILNIPPKGNESISVFPEGTMFYFRVRALEKLLNAENPLSTLAVDEEKSASAALTTVLPCIVQDAGYHFNYVISDELLVSTFHIYSDRLSSLFEYHDCEFDLYYAAAGEGHSEKKKISRILYAYFQTFVIRQLQGMIDSKNSLWRMDFGNRGEVFRIFDIRFMDKNRDCLISLKKNPEIFSWVNCCKKEDGNSFIFAPLNDDPQIHVQFTKQIDPKKIDCIYFDMHRENPASFSGKYFETELQLDSQVRQNSELQHDLSRRINQLQEMQNAISDGQAKLQHIQNLLDVKNEEVGDLQKNIDCKNTEIGNLKSDIDDKNTEIGNLKSDIDDKNAEISDLWQNVTKKALDITELQKNIELKKTEIYDLRENIENKNSTIETLQSNIDSNNLEITGLKANIENKNIEITDLKKHIQNKDAQITGLQNDIDGKKSMIETLQRHIDEKNAQLAESHAQADAMSQELDRIYNSRLWRWSEPFRNFFDKLNKEK